LDKFTRARAFIIILHRGHEIEPGISRSLSPEAAEDVKSRGGRLQKAASGGIEARSGDQSARSAEKNFRLHFSVIRMGSRGTFVFCTDAPGSML